MFDEYLKTTGKPIEASIRGELSGDFEKPINVVTWAITDACILKFLADDKLMNKVKYWNQSPLKDFCNVCQRSRV